MKKKKILALLAAVMAVCGSAQAQEASLEPTSSAKEQEARDTEAGAEEETSAAEVQETGDDTASSAELSDDWKDFQIQIDGEVYAFPMMYEDFAAMGWEADEEEVQSELEPYEYDMISFSKDDKKCTAYVLNLGMNNAAAADCIVGGVSIDHFDWELENGTVALPGGIVRGQADTASIEAAYGTPSDTYDGELYTELTYETDYNCSVTAYVYKESGVLEDIEVRNFTEPDGYDAGTVSEEVPADVLAYVKPEALSSDLSEYQMELDGEVYAFPVPVSVLIEDGWELDTADSDSEVRAHYYGWVTLRKGGQEISEIAVNRESYATIPENCWIEGLEAGGYSLDLEGALPGGIHTGMTEADFLKILDDGGVSYEVDDSSDSFKYYVYNEQEYDQCFEVTVYTADDGYFERDSVIEVSCRNAF